MTGRVPMRRRPTALLVAAIMVVAVVAGVAAACGGDDDGGAPAATRPAVELIAPAVEALEAELGGPQEYFEINVDDRLVNLFVADRGATSVVPYVYLDGELGPPAPAQPVAEGATFVADDLGFDADAVLGQVSEELPSATMRRFVVLVGPEGAVRYEVFVESSQGGQLAVLVTADGEVLGVETL